MSITTESFYITSGTLHGDAACYIERRADADLYADLYNGRGHKRENRNAAAQRARGISRSS
jgi:hypothetical protein